jgi:hypothetical protein
VIIRPEGTSLLFMTQPDHAALAGEMATHFAGFAANPRRDAIALAVREHDSGWHTVDAALQFDAAQGRALDFIGVPETVKQSVWPDAIDRLAPHSAYAAALVAEHALFVYSANRDKPDWRTFFAQLTIRRDDLLRDGGVPLATLQADYPLLGIADLVSLAFCHGWPDARERFGRTIRCVGDAVTMSPSLLPEAGIPIVVPVRRIADRRYASVEEVRAALQRAAPETLAGVARAGALA